MPDISICEVLGNERVTDVAYGITVRSGSIAAIARAGQFLHIKCGDSRLLRRPFGISSVRGEEVSFIFEVKGEGTRWLSGRKPGEELDILGPCGNGFYLPEGDIIVAGGGLGSPPLLFAAQSAKRGVTAVLGFREKSRIMLVAEFEDVCDKVVLTTDDGSAGIHGTVMKPLKELLLSGDFAAVLACGQLAMQQAVAELCQQHGVPCQVSLEQRMGCGVGACMACACVVRKDGEHRMSRVCADGPVFDAADVVWS